VQKSPKMAKIFAFVASLCLFYFQLYARKVQWVLQTSHTTARLRGVSAVNAKVAWASGSNGTYLKTIDGGSTWQAATVPGAESLDFRDVEAFDASTAYLLSIGEGEKSRIYKTTDGGKNWNLQFTNHNPKAFFDAIVFWDANRGIAFSDPVDGHFLIIRTNDGGATWKEVPPGNIPPALPDEGGFAASGTCIAVQGRNNVWIGTGGGAARVFRSVDGGDHWQVATTPIISGQASSGIFSIAFKDAMQGVIVGGDYKKESEARDNVATTEDGGRTWALVKGKLPGGFRSGISYISGMYLAVGPAGSDYSLDGGANWMSFGSEGFHAISFARSGAGWAVGEKGKVGKTQYRSRD
jgi:photosystem II stability/assembly factor-like uncharacterized protein